MSEPLFDPRDLFIVLAGFLIGIGLIVLAKVYQIYRLRTKQPQSVYRYAIELGVLTSGDFVWGYSTLLVILCLFLQLSEILFRGGSTFNTPLLFLSVIFVSGTVGYFIVFFFGLPMIITTYVVMGVFISRMLQNYGAELFVGGRTRLLVALASGAVLATIVWSFAIFLNPVLRDINMKDILGFPFLIGFFLVAMIVPGVVFFLQSITMTIKLRDYLLNPFDSPLDILL